MSSLADRLRSMATTADRDEDIRDLHTAADQIDAARQLAAALANPKLEWLDYDGMEWCGWCGADPPTHKPSCPRQAALAAAQAAGIEVTP